ncbi:MAG TPA: TIGR01440 family protein, partial [Negativicutes bacterium]|nr:TIGR01440 family protein [Negativicutes bacterium]
MDTDLEEIKRQAAAAAAELLTVAGLKPGQIVVVGCSTSEVRGAKIGSYGSEEVAAAILAALRESCQARGVYLAVQCCEHLNRALVVERPAAESYGLEEVSVVPVPKAGGALAAQAMRDFSAPVVVETIQAQAGLDIGATLIGMHIKRVAVPVRLGQKLVGQAPVTAARTRPKLIGGARAVYEMPPH